MDSKTTKLYRGIWGVLLIVALFVEMLTLPKGHRDTLSETIWDVVRWSNWRVVFLPSWTWLTWHWVLRKVQIIDYKDYIAIAIGIIWALIEIYMEK